MAVHPVQIYESALLLVLFLFLHRVPLEHSRPGMIAALTAISYTVIRFVIEYVRADGALAMGNLTTTQLQCVLLMVITLFAASFMRPVRG